MKKILFLFVLTLLFLSNVGVRNVKVNFHNVKTQSINCYKLLGCTDMNKLEEVKAFEISDFITYGVYKVYLEAIKKDSSQLFYLKQLPDSTICLKECYQTYLNSTKYDLSPVVGISWDAAMNFCKWKTFKDKKGNDLKFIYSLPTTAEWLVTNLQIGTKIDINLNYSDWLLATKDETLYYYDSEKIILPFYSYIYFHYQDDPKVLKRKVAIGNSFLFKQKILKSFFNYSYYSENGYKHIAFRIVKKEVGDTSNFLINSILNFWGV